jgi:hypothetical protein
LNKWFVRNKKQVKINKGWEFTIVRLFVCSYSEFVRLSLREYQPIVTAQYCQATSYRNIEPYKEKQLNSFTNLMIGAKPPVRLGPKQF